MYSNHVGKIHKETYSTNNNKIKYRTLQVSISMALAHKMLYKFGAIFLIPHKLKMI